MYSFEERYSLLITPVERKRFYCTLSHFAFIDTPRFPPQPSVNISRFSQIFCISTQVFYAQIENVNKNLKSWNIWLFSILQDHSEAVRLQFWVASGDWTPLCLIFNCSYFSLIFFLCVFWLCFGHFCVSQVNNKSNYGGNEDEQNMYFFFLHLHISQGSEHRTQLPWHIIGNCKRGNWWCVDIFRWSQSPSLKDPLIWIYYKEI